MGGLAPGILADQYEVPSIGDKDELILVPILSDLFTGRRQPGVIVYWLDLYHAALRGLAFTGFSFLHLIILVEAEVRMARALVGKFTHAKDLRFQGAAYCVEQVVQGRVE